MSFLTFVRFLVIQDDRSQLAIALTTSLQRFRLSLVTLIARLDVLEQIIIALSTTRSKVLEALLALKNWRAG